MSRVLGIEVGLALDQLITHNVHTTRQCKTLHPQTQTTQCNGTLGVTGVTSITNTTDSSATNSGALVVSGGVGIAKKLYVGTIVNALGI